MPTDTTGSTDTGTAQGAPAGQGGAADQPQGGGAGTPGAQGAPAGQSTDGTAAGDRPQTLAEALAAFEQAQTRATELEAAVAERERENAGYREQRRQAEAAAAAAAREGMTTEDQLRADLAERDTELTTLRTTTAELQGQLDRLTFVEDVAPVATALGFRNPRLAARLVDRASCVRDDGTVDPDRIRTALQAELTADPYLAGAAGTDAGAGRGAAAGAATFNDQIRQAARRGAIG